MRRKPAVILLLALSAAAALLASMQGWLELRFDAATAGLDAAALNGKQLTAPLVPIALAALAATVALTIARGTLRRVIGVLLAAFGVAIVLLAVAVVREPLNAASGEIASLTGLLGSAQRDLVLDAHVTAWPTVVIVAGAILAITGAWATIVAGHWGVGGSRYDTSRADTRGPAGEPDRIADWDSMNDGIDPSESDESPLDSGEQRRQAGSPEPWRNR